MVFDGTARYNIERGAAKQLTHEELLDLIDEAGKYPTFQVGSPVKDVQSFGGLICNCHWDCCPPRRPAFLPDAKFTPQQWIPRSRFEATVDPAKCTGCKTCVEEKCQFGAAQMKNYPEYEGERSYTDAELCIGCGSCVETCPAGARGMKIVLPPEHVTEGRERPGEYERQPSG